MNHQSFWNKRIHPIFSVILLIGGVLLTGWLAQSGVIYLGRATGNNTPTAITVTNITDRSFTVTYLTTGSVLGTVTYGEDGDKTVPVDQRDQKSGKPSPYTVHSIPIRNLKPSTTYSFSINSGGKSFLDNGKNFSVKTAEKLAGEEPDNKPVTGSLTASDGNAPKEAIAYLTTNSGQILSGLAKDNGTYALTTSSFRKKDLSAFITLLPTTELKLRIASLQGVSEVSVLVKGSNPVPLITLSKKYNFSVTNDPGTNIAATESATITSFPLPGQGDSSPTTSSVTILSPKDEQALSDQKPMFKGTAPPNVEVEITINSDEPIQANVISDRRGNWSYRPKTALTPGEHTITVAARQPSGIIKTLTQSFTVLAAGSQFTDPSVSPPKESPTPTPIKPEPTRKPTLPATPTPAESEPTSRPTQAIATPTQSAVSTPTPISSSATISIAPSTEEVSISPNPSIVPTGNNDVILYSLIGTIAIVAGALLLFLTGGMSL